MGHHATAHGRLLGGGSDRSSSGGGLLLLLPVQNMRVCGRLLLLLLLLLLHEESLCLLSLLPQCHCLQVGGTASTSVVQQAGRRYSKHVGGAASLQVKRSTLTKPSP